MKQSRARKETKRNTMFLFHGLHGGAWEQEFAFQTHGNCGLGGDMSANSTQHEWFPFTQSAQAAKKQQQP